MCTRTHSHVHPTYPSSPKDNRFWASWLLCIGLPLWKIYPFLFTSPQFPSSDHQALPLLLCSWDLLPGTYGTPHPAFGNCHLLAPYICFLGFFILCFLGSPPSAFFLLVQSHVELVSGHPEFQPSFSMMLRVPILLFLVCTFIQDDNAYRDPHLPVSWWRLTHAQDSFPVARSSS